MKFQTINPATEEVLGEYEYARFDEAVEETRKLKQSAEWRRTDASEKAKAFTGLAGELRNGKRAYAETMSKEMGKPVKQGVAEVEKCAWLCDYYAGNAAEFLEPERISTEFNESYVELAPLGVVLGVMPWNFPFWQWFRFSIPTLLAGNRVVLKHAPNVPASALLLNEIFSKHLPENTFLNLFLEVGDVGRLIESPVVDAVSITGSTRAGSSVAQLAGKHIKKTVLELGGSDAFIVLEDADLPKACVAAGVSRFVNAGQSCIAAKRFIAVKQIAEEFTELFVEQVKKLKTGDPLAEETDVGPIARKDLLQGLHDTVARSIAQGAKVLVGGKPREGKGFFYEPTVLAGVGPDTAAAREETFGPVAPILVAESVSHAIQLANNSEYGLGASVWTRDTAKAKKLASAIDAGFVSINEVVKSDPRLPFGGVKKSGYGRELSHHGLREFANIKTITVREKIAVVPAVAAASE